MAQPDLTDLAVIHGLCVLGEECTNTLITAVYKLAILTEDTDFFPESAQWGTLSQLQQISGQLSSLRERVTTL